ncbi:MAG: glycosyltransferase family 2 protein [Nitrospirae bacterium]|nr:glycosyltransferase family 2 protein [Nitrospirota bacterium]
MISYIIPNWNHRDLLFECIKSICGTARDNMSHEIIVVDNGSTDDSAEYIKRRFPEVIWVQNNINLGYAKAINQGVEISKGDFLFLLNNDIELTADAAGLLIDFLDKTPDAGAVAPLLFYPDGRLQISCRRFPTSAAIFLEKLAINRLGSFRRLRLTGDEHLAGGVVLQPMASALMVKRECWDAVGQMDEGFPIFFNDVDWCYRLYKKTEYKIYLCPEAKAVHHEGASVKRLGYKKKIMLYKGLIRFYQKHFPFANKRRRY